MRFLSSHFHLCLYALFMGGSMYALLRLQSAQSTLDRFKLTLTRSLEFKAFLILTAFIVLGWSFCGKTIYYFPNSPGVLGDNYFHMYWALKGIHWIKPHHMVFPLAAEEVIRIAKGIGWLNIGDPLYLEKVFGLSSLPVRLLAVSGLLLTFWIFSQECKSLFLGILAALMLGATYAYWIWGIQSNAIGMAIAWEVIVLAAFLALFKRPGWILLAALGILISASVFIHISLIYFNIGAFIALSIYIFFMAPWSCVRKAGSFGFLFLVCSSCALLFFHAEFRLLKTHSIPVVFNTLADTPYNGNFSASWRVLLHGLKDNIIASIYNITNLWRDSNSFQSLLVFLQFSAMIALGFSLLRYCKQSLFALRKEFGLLLALTSLSILAGFCMQQAGGYHYAIAVVPNLFLLIYVLLFPMVEDREKTRRALLLSIVWATLFLYSGFSDVNVLRGSNLEENEYYHTMMLMAKDMGPHKVGYYFEPIANPYERSSLYGYYWDRFGSVQWEPYVSRWGNANQFARNIRVLLAQSSNVFVGQRALDVLGNETRNFQLVMLGKDLWRVLPER